MLIILPTNIIGLIIVLTIAVFCFGFKFFAKNLFKDWGPLDLRKCTSLDGHKCCCTVEIEVDNWLRAQIITHDKPISSPDDFYYSKSKGVPNFIIYHPNWKKSKENRKIHSIIVIKGLDTQENIIPLNSDIMTKKDRKNLRVFSIEAETILTPQWREEAHAFYEHLREDIIENAKDRGINLIDMRKRLK